MATINQNNQNQELDMRQMTVGVEVEFSYITREQAAKAIASYFGVTHSRSGSNYEVKAPDGRVWKLVYDASIKAEKKGGGYAGDDYKVELVSPILKYDDIETLQEIIRALRKAGAKPSQNCGCHIHCSSAGMTSRALINVLKIVKSKEELLYKALGVEEDRLRWCKRIDEPTLARVSKAKTESDVRRAWYDGRDANHQRYASQRYQAVNFCPIWRQGTLEYRLFNAGKIEKCPRTGAVTRSLHAGLIKTYIQLALAITHQAKMQKGASSRATQTENPAYAMRVWLLRLGFIGDDTKSARYHLLKNLEGNKAWRNGQQRLAA